MLPLDVVTVLPARRCLRSSAHASRAQRHKLSGHAWTPAGNHVQLLHRACRPALMLLGVQKHTLSEQVWGSPGVHVRLLRGACPEAPLAPRSRLPVAG